MSESIVSDAVSIQVDGSSQQDITAKDLEQSSSCKQRSQTGE